MEQCAASRAAVRCVLPACQGWLLAVPAHRRQARSGPDFASSAAPPTTSSAGVPPVVTRITRTCALSHSPHVHAGPQS